MDEAAGVQHDREDETTPHLMSSALITIDMQLDVVDGGTLSVAGTREALPGVERLTELFRQAGRPIVHAVRLYLPDASNVDLCRRRSVREGALTLLAETDGSQLLGELASGQRLDAGALLAGSLQRLGPEEVVMYKPRWGAFFQTPLADHLQDAGVDTLVFCGCNFPNCPRTSIYEASERDYRVVLVTDAISGLYERGTEEMRNIGVALMSVAEIEAAVRAEARVSS